MKPMIVMGADHAGWSMKEFLKASLVSDLFSAQMTREHNAANILCLGARVIANQMAWEITKVWLASEPLGGKYANRVTKIMDYEKTRT